MCSVPGGKLCESKAARCALSGVISVPQDRVCACRAQGMPSLDSIPQIGEVKSSSCQVAIDIGSASQRGLALYLCPCQPRVVSSGRRGLSQRDSKVPCQRLQRALSESISLRHQSLGVTYFWSCAYWLLRKDLSADNISIMFLKRCRQALC
jgi:hypothetical protein